MFFMCSDLNAAGLSISCFWSLMLPFSCSPYLSCVYVYWTLWIRRNNWQLEQILIYMTQVPALTSVTAKLLFPHGTTLYHLSCRTSMKPWDLYWLISSEMFEVSGELGGRPIPYPRRKNSTIISLLLVCFFLLNYVHFNYQVGILFQQASSNLDAGLPWTEKAKMRLFAVQNKVA